MPSTMAQAVRCSATLLDKRPSFRRRRLRYASHLEQLPETIEHVFVHKGTRKGEGLISGFGTKRTSQDVGLFVRFRSEADEHGHVASLASVTNDPKRTLARPKSRSAAAKGVFRLAGSYHVYRTVPVPA
jgi:hypothetical protein